MKVPNQLPLLALAANSAATHKISTVSRRYSWKQEVLGQGSRRQGSILTVRIIRTRNG